MAMVAVIGMQWGDEGKGKIIDFLARRADIIERYQGGDNAGHTIWLHDKKYVFHSTPSGILYPEKYNISGDGMYFNPIAAMKEIKELQRQGVEISPKNYGISGYAHVTLDYHKDYEQFLEELMDGARAGGKVESTKKGIGPTGSFKMNRVGIRFAEFLDEETFGQALERVLIYTNKTLGTDYKAKEYLEQYREAREFLKPFLMDERTYIRQHGEKNILFEGAQGTFLDIDYGSYPFVTASNPTIKGIGYPIDHVIGVAKAYITRVGAGNMPTILGDHEETKKQSRLLPEEYVGMLEKINRGEATDAEIGRYLRAIGDEFGATTGRPRDCGWFDVPLIIRARDISFVDSLAITKGDVLNGMKEVKICTEYKLDGRKIPYEKIGIIIANRRLFAQVEPIYQVMNGWQSLDDTNYDLYLSEIKRLVGIPISIISTGKERDNINMIIDPFIKR